MIIEEDYNNRIDKSISKGNFFNSMGYLLENVLNKYKIQKKDIGPWNEYYDEEAAIKQMKRKDKSAEKKNPFVAPKLNISSTAHILEDDMQFQTIKSSGIMLNQQSGTKLNSSMQSERSLADL